MGTKPDMDRTRMAAGGECCVCTAAGAAPLRRRRCGLRQSARDRRAAEGSSSSLAAALAASTCRAPDYASQHERCLRRCCVADGAAPYPRRHGTLEGHMFGRGMRPPAPPDPTRACANACADHFDVYDEPGQENFEIALRFGVYSRRLVALARNGAFTILTGTASMYGDLAVRASSSRLLRPNSNSCLTEFWSTPARTSHSSNSPAHTRM